jgi:Protein of unknown function (DUF3261)
VSRFSNFHALHLLLALASCAPQPTTAASEAQAAAAVGVLHSPAELGGDFQWRQQVTAHWPSGTRTFDAVLSKDGSDLLLVGLGPMDTPGFILRVNDKGELSVENNTGQPMPFDAKFVLLDVQRAFYPWFTTQATSGVRTTTRDEETVAETWRDGLLTERDFVRVDGKPQGVIEISYEGWTQGERAPKRITLKNGWHGYTLVIETLEQTNLD